MKKYKVVACVYFGGIHTVKKFKSKKKAKKFAKKRNNTPDMYTFFSVKKIKNRF